jgi:hypothetical protein
VRRWFAKQWVQIKRIGNTVDTLAGQFQNKLKQPGKFGIDIVRAQSVAVLDAFFCCADKTSFTQDTEMVGKCRFCHLGTGRSFGARHASVFLHHAFNDAQAHGVSQRAKHTREADVLFRGMNELNHKKEYIIPVDKVQ